MFKQSLKKNSLASLNRVIRNSISQQEDRRNGINRDIFPEQVKQIPLQSIRKISSSYTFHDYHVEMFSQKPLPTNGFTSSDLDEAFIRFSREVKRQKGNYLGDKLHISVSPNQIEKSFDLISHLLFSNDSPFDRWKMTSLKVIQREPNERISCGMQITCYIYPKNESSEYSLLDFIEVRSMINEIEEYLKKSDIKPGKVDQSDVQAPHWRYVSYRNEFRSERSNNNEHLKEDPFFTLLSVK
jgi:phosphothreonine lyase